LDRNLTFSLLDPSWSGVDFILVLHAGQHIQLVLHLLRTQASRVLNIKKITITTEQQENVIIKKIASFSWQAIMYPFLGQGPLAISAASIQITALCVL
jgi:hypothetical protein